MKMKQDVSTAPGHTFARTRVEVSGSLFVPPVHARVLARSIAVAFAWIPLAVLSALRGGRYFYRF